MFQELNSFIIQPGVCVPGISPEGFEAFSEDLIECGNNFRSLDLMIKRNTMIVSPAAFDGNITDCTLPTSTSSMNTACTSEALKTSDITAHKGLVFQVICLHNCLVVYVFCGFLLVFLYVYQSFIANLHGAKISLN